MSVLGIVSIDMHEWVREALGEDGRGPPAPRFIAPVIGLDAAAARVSEARRLGEAAESPALVVCPVERMVVIVTGEIDAESWEQIAERMHVAAADGAPEVVLDLRGCPHARPIPPRAAGYVRALEQRGAVVVVRCSAYVRACIQASRYGCELAVRWEVA